MESHKVYVGNLAHYVTEEEIEDLFAEFGDIMSVKIKPQEGFAFVEYSTIEEAENAIHGTNGKEFSGRTLKVEDAGPVRYHIPG
ncbi:RNA recognition motif domain-containing protein [Methanoplanus limicola]|uniref:RNP-1 like RNA-binding protein n=1 Tax=Methanoplanus limicola DSM 2279 TaxID=937775 RepID=H1Z2W2_9EURY|nr:RNA-binding protein [Methanoplanus limicola]EHQ34701.1 RNP-1 like RNA-binding protein [Methanoplanus limicola DSM 2279]